MYFDGQGSQILPCGKIPGNGVWGGMGWLIVCIKEQFLITQYIPSLISFVVSVDVKHHVYLLTIFLFKKIIMVCAVL